MTKQYGILAYPAKQSLSPVMHNTAFKVAGIDAQYGTFEIPENKFQEFMEQVKHTPISGLSISLPYKLDVMEYLDSVDEDAKKIGAVNTVVNKGGFLYGYNTDFIGSNEALKEVVGDLKGKIVAVFGAGGAARAICYGLLKEGAELSIFNRTVSKAVELAKEFSEMFGVEVKSGGWNDMMALPKVDIVVQASSIWTLNPGLSAGMVRMFLPSGFEEKFDVVMDIAYKPLLTPLLEIAKDAGKQIITGDKMLLHQAVEQFKLWTDKEAPVEEMKKVLEDNIV